MRGLAIAELELARGVEDVRLDRIGRIGESQRRVEQADELLARARPLALLVELAAVVQIVDRRRVGDASARGDRDRDARDQGLPHVTSTTCAALTVTERCSRSNSTLIDFDENELGKKIGRRSSSFAGLPSMTTSAG